MLFIQILLSITLAFLLINVAFVVMEYGIRLKVDRQEVERYYALQKEDDYSEEQETFNVSEEELVFTDEAFDSRIAKLKAELIANNFDKRAPHEPTKADILDDAIYNLPHDDLASYGGDNIEDYSR